MRRNLLKRTLVWSFIFIFGIILGLLYSYWLYCSLNVETVIVFVVLYLYFVMFIRFLIKLFK